MKSENESSMAEKMQKLDHQSRSYNTSKFYERYEEKEKKRLKNFDQKLKIIES